MHPPLNFSQEKKKETLICNASAKRVFIARPSASYNGRKKARENPGTMTFVRRGGRLYFHLRRARVYPLMAVPGRFLARIGKFCNSRALSRGGACALASFLPSARASEAVFTDALAPSYCRGGRTNCIGYQLIADF